MLFFSLSLALLVSQASAGITYTQGSATVEVTVTYWNDTKNSFLEKCAEFKSGAPEKYTKACFLERFTDDGTWDDCDIYFNDNDDDYCNSCSRCVTGKEETGIQIDCDRFFPAKGTNFLCDKFDNSTVQNILVGDKFDGQQFNFSVLTSDGRDGVVGSDGNVDVGSKISASSSVSNYVTMASIAAFASFLVLV